MKKTDLLVRFYSVLLYLYPRSYRQEFGEERLAVFQMALNDATTGREFWRLAAHELLELPGAILREQGRAAARAGDPAWEKPAPWPQLLGAVLLFFLIGADRLLEAGGIMGSLPQVIGLVFILIFFFLLAGIFTGFPRWTIPYAGLVVGAVGFYTYAILLDKASRAGWVGLPRLMPGDENARLFLSFFRTGIDWWMTLLFAAALLLLLGLLPPVRRFWSSLRRDWTRPIFFVYSMVPFLLILNFDDYRYEQLTMVAVLSVLALGVVLYLRLPNPWSRLLALVACLTLAMGITTIGKWFLVPLQDWPVWFGWHPPQVERRFEAMQQVYNWFWITTSMLVLGLPGLFRSFRRASYNPADIVMEGG